MVWRHKECGVMRGEGRGNVIKERLEQASSGAVVKGMQMGCVPTLCGGCGCPAMVYTGYLP